MSDFAISTEGKKAYLPLFGSPTVCMAKSIEYFRDRKNGWLSRQVIARSLGPALVAASTFEALSHLAAAAVTCIGIVGRVILRNTNRFLASVVAAVWGLVYGGAITLDITVWLRRLIINIVLFSRDINIAWEHWMERRVAATDLLWVSTKMWAIAHQVDTVLRRPFNVTRLIHHADGSWQHTIFSIQNILSCITDPDRLVQDCKSRKLGKAMPARSLSTRLWKMVMRHKGFTLLTASIFAIAMDYFLQKPITVNQYLEKAYERISATVFNMCGYSFGILVNTRMVLSALRDWFPQDLEKKALEIEVLKLQKQKLERWW